MKADVFHAYLSLLKQTRPAQSWLTDPDAMEQGETPLTMLQSQVRNGEGLINGWMVGKHISVSKTSESQLILILQNRTLKYVNKTTHCSLLF